MARAWIITKDLIWDKMIDDRAGTVGPSNAPDHMIAILKEGGGYAFELYDDDGELYYEGRAIWDERSPASGPYGPLGDFGEPDSGCTAVIYPGNRQFDCS